MHVYPPEYGNQPTDDIVRHLTNIPMTAELAPQVEPGPMPFLQKLHARQRELLEDEYRSPTLLNSAEPANQILSFTHEAELYVGSLSRQDREQTEKLAAQLSNAHPPRVSVCLPVASHEEGRNLYKVLEHYVGQTMPRDDYEVYLFLNRPALDSNGMPTDDRETMQALEDFKRDYPGTLNINVASAIFEQPLNLGEIKKIHFDSHVLRCLEAGVQDPILIMNDVDMVKTSENYLTKYVSYFEQSPLVDAVIGEFDLDHGAYVTSPFVHVAYRAHMLISTLKGNSLRRIVNSNNSAMRASAYCALGGNTKMKRTSDAYMGVALTQLRGSNTTVLRPQDQEIAIQTSARRVMAAWHKGYAPNEKWRLNLGAHNAEVRKIPDGVATGEELFNLDDTYTLSQTLEYILNRLIGNYEEDGDDPRGWESPLYREALSLLGITYTLSIKESGEPCLRLDDITDLRRALYTFRQNHLNNVY